MNAFLRTANALMALVLMAALIASIKEQLIDGQIPCAYCILQRALLLCVSLGLLLNLRFGIQIKHYALSLLSSLLGAAISLTQISLHACPQFPIFGAPVLGLSLYTWAFLVFASSLFSITLFLYFYTPTPPHPTLLSRLAFALVFLTSLTLAGLTFSQCGFGDCQKKPFYG